MKRREMVAVALSFSLVPVLVLTITGAAPWTLTAWCACWIVSLLTKETTR